MDLISGIGTYLLPFLIILSVVVFVHELGHYLVARWAGVRVDVFSIGFGPELFGFTARSGTRWKFSALPLGGYVKMHGDADRHELDGRSYRPARSRQLPVEDGVAAHGDRCGRSRRQSPVRDRRARSAVRDRRPPVYAGGDRRGAAGQRRRRGRPAARRPDRRGRSGAARELRAAPGHRAHSSRTCRCGSRSSATARAWT